MRKFKQVFNESSLSRIWKMTNEHDSGTISAFRSARDCNEGEEYSLSDNKKNSSLLKSKLLSLGYGVTKIDGAYIENYGTDKAVEVKEDSYIVVDIKDSGNLKEDLIKLGTLFEQDSITYQTKGQKYFLISTNKCPFGYPGSGKIGVEIELGKSIFGKDGEFHSKINGRPFVFEGLDGITDFLINYYPTEIRSIKETSKIDKV